MTDTPEWAICDIITGRILSKDAAQHNEIAQQARATSASLGAKLARLEDLGSPTANSDLRRSLRTGALAFLSVGLHWRV